VLDVQSPKQNTLNGTCDLSSHARWGHFQHLLQLFKYCKFITTLAVTYNLLLVGPQGHFGHFVIHVSTKTLERQQL
jgi:hypothetical protein